MGGFLDPRRLTPAAQCHTLVQTSSSSRMRLGASLAFAIRSLDDEEAHHRELELVELLASWVENSVSAQRLRDLHETMRFAVWTTVRHPDRNVVLAEERAQPVGIVIGELKRTQHGRHGFVDWIAVKPDRRCQGIGSALITELATAIGVGRLEGSVDLDDPVASSFWERQGWTRIKPAPRRVMMGGPAERR